MDETDLVGQLTRNDPARTAAGALDLRAERDLHAILAAPVEEAPGDAGSAADPWVKRPPRWTVQLAIIAGAAAAVIAVVAVVASLVAPRPVPPATPEPLPTETPALDLPPAPVVLWDGDCDAELGAVLGDGLELQSSTTMPGTLAQLGGVQCEWLGVDGIRVSLRALPDSVAPLAAPSDEIRPAPREEGNTPPTTCDWTDVAGDIRYDLVVTLGTEPADAAGARAACATIDEPLREVMQRTGVTTTARPEGAWRLPYPCRSLEGEASLQGDEAEDVPTDWATIDELVRFGRDGVDCRFLLHDTVYSVELIGGGAWLWGGPLTYLDGQDELAATPGTVAGHPSLQWTYRNGTTWGYDIRFGPNAVRIRTPAGSTAIERADQLAAFVRYLDDNPPLTGEAPVRTVWTPGPGAPPLSDLRLTTSGLGELRVGGPAGADPSILVWDDDYCLTSFGTPGEDGDGLWIPNYVPSTKPGYTWGTLIGIWRERDADFRPTDTIEIIGVMAPGIVTDRGVGVGSTYDEVLAAYPDAEHHQTDFDVFVVRDSAGTLVISVPSEDGLNPGTVLMMAVLAPGADWQVPGTGAGDVSLTDACFYA